VVLPRRGYTLLSCFLLDGFHGSDNTARIDALVVGLSELELEWGDGRSQQLEHLA